MTQKNLYIAIALLTALLSSAQIDTAAYWKFDAKRFGKPDPQHTSRIYTRDSCQVELIESHGIYQVGLTPRNSDTTIYYMYYKSTGTLQRYLMQYKRMNTGVSHTYNEKGKMIEAEDFDAPYKVSLTELLNQLRAEFHIDLKDPKHPTGIIRSTNPAPPYYQVFHYLQTGMAGVARTLVIDAESGKVVLDETNPYDSCKAR